MKENEGGFVVTGVEARITVQFIESDGIEPSGESFIPVLRSLLEPTEGFFEFEEGSQSIHPFWSFDEDVFT
jgi:hypothetical protein